MTETAHMVRLRTIGSDEVEELYMNIREDGRRNVADERSPDSDLPFKGRRIPFPSSRN